MLRNALGQGRGRDGLPAQRGIGGSNSKRVLLSLSVCVPVRACVWVAGFKVSGVASGREKPEPVFVMSHPGACSGCTTKRALLLESRIWALSASLGGRSREG